jgi:hypothetical protein
MAKLAPVVAPVAVAVTLYAPVVEFAVHVTDALPFASVVAEAAESAQDAPVDGAANATATPLVGVPPVVTFATSG